MTTSTEHTPLRIVLADDHAVLRAGLRALLEDEPDFAIVGEAGNGAEAVTLVERRRPDVVVMDLDMPELDGLEATRRISAAGLSTKVLVLTMHDEEAHILKVLEAGGSGYVLKSAAERELMQAIRTVARGEVFLYPAATRLLLRSYLAGERGAAESRPARGRLSEREEQVLALTAEGYSNHEIAGRLYLSSKTVDTYRQRIMEKLDLHHRSELVRYALDKGLLKPGGA
ncbi:MAG TPA: response regulator transcription factor [Dehalococcoidia bacterium]|nr:response regulator transcription factor [Dehalococcoidia bacterium]